MNERNQARKKEREDLTKLGEVTRKLKVLELQASKNPNAGAKGNLRKSMTMAKGEYVANENDKGTQTDGKTH